MRHLRSRLLRTLWQIVVITHTLPSWRQRWRVRGRSDRGTSVVETAILVGGFAVLAVTIYVTVSGKVESWIHKIP